MGKHEKKWEKVRFWEILRNFEGKKFLIRKPNQRRSRHPQVCFHFQIKKTCLFQYLFFQIDPFQDVSFQTISFSGGVFSDYILFKPCLVILHPFQHLSLLTISSSETSESRTFFSVQTWHKFIRQLTEKEKHMRHPDINIYETLVGTVFQQVS